jgi:hypothetical protein
VASCGEDVGETLRGARRVVGVRFVLLEDADISGLGVVSGSGERKRGMGGGWRIVVG